MAGARTRGARGRNRAPRAVTTPVRRTTTVTVPTGPPTAAAAVAGTNRTRYGEALADGTTIPVGTDPQPMIDAARREPSFCFAKGVHRITVPSSRAPVTRWPAASAQYSAAPCDSPDGSEPATAGRCEVRCPRRTRSRASARTTRPSRASAASKCSGRQPPDPRDEPAASSSRARSSVTTSQRRLRRATTRPAATSSWPRRGPRSTSRPTTSP